MAAHRKRPLPATRMADLLVDRKRELLDADVQLTSRVFEAAWAEAWEQMIGERAYPHATEHRRQWKSALVACKFELRAAFLDVPTPFGDLAEALRAAGERQEVHVQVSDLPRAFLGAIAAYGATDESERVGENEQEAMRA